MATAVVAPSGTAPKYSPLVWWHLLSLDAPVVATLWAAFLAHQFRVALPAAAPIALGIAVWLLYAGDRINDARRGETLEERHRFHFTHRNTLIAVGTLLIPLLLFLLLLLPTELRRAWMALVLPLAAYVAAVHSFHGRRVSKEPLVAVFFAVGTAIPLFVAHQMALSQVASIATAFASLCWLNCTAIARWEQALAGSDPCTAWLGKHFGFAAAATCIVTVPLWFHVHGTPVSLACMSAAAGLYILDRNRRHLARTTLRSLADAALLTPLAVWPLTMLARAAW